MIFVCYLAGMKLLTFFALLNMYSFSSFSCDSLKGTWKSCKVSSPRLNIIEEAIFRSYMKPYTLKFNYLSDGTIRSIGTYKKLFGKVETLHDDTIPTEEVVTLHWNRLPTSSTAPILEVYVSCAGDKLEESLEWINLNSDNYTEEELESNHRYFKSIYSVQNNKFIRYVVSKQKENEAFTHLATLTCVK